MQLKGPVLNVPSVQLSVHCGPHVSLCLGVRLSDSGPQRGCEELVPWEDQAHG